MGTSLTLQTLNSLKSSLSLLVLQSFINAKAKCLFLLGGQKLFISKSFAIHVSPPPTVLCGVVLTLYSEAVCVYLSFLSNNWKALCNPMKQRK